MIVLIYVLVYLLLNALFLLVLGKNCNRHYLRYYLISIFFTPVIAGLRVVLDKLDSIESPNVENKKEVKQEPIKLEGGQLYVEKGRKRVRIYESEKEDFINDGWSVIE